MGGGAGAVEAAGHTVLDLSLGSPDQPMPDALINAVAEAVQDRKAHGYPAMFGEKAFGETFTAYMHRRFGVTIDPVTEVVPTAGARLPGIDGKAKMSKSLGNALPLSASPDEISHAVKMMYTDAHHLRVDDPGQVEGNVVFAYLDAFEPDSALVADLKARYQRGGLGDSVIKKQLEERLQALLAPIRARREHYAQDPAQVMALLKEGTYKARAVAAQTLAEVKAAMGLNYY